MPGAGIGEAKEEKHPGRMASTSPSSALACPLSADRPSSSSSGTFQSSNTILEHIPAVPRRMASTSPSSTLACPLSADRPPSSSSGTFQSSNTIPEYIPAVPKASPEASGAGVRSRNLILCFDGTGDKFDEDNTNVVRLFSTFKKDDPTQKLYYQSGIGTYSGRSELISGISAYVDMAIAHGLGFHVRGGYEFLQQNYQQGDRICLFGFSRGAYTARALAGMLHKVGLLPTWNSEQISFAYEMYETNNVKGWALAVDFKKTFCIDVEVHFLGVWDAVASVGLIPRHLPYAHSSNSSVRYFRHALALDERRARFRQNHWIEALNDPSTLAQSTGQYYTTPERHAIETRQKKCAETRPKLSIIIPPPFRTKASRHGDDLARSRAGAANGSTSAYDTLGPHLALESNVEHATKIKRILRGIKELYPKIDRGNVDAIKEDWFDAMKRAEGREPLETDVLEVWFAGGHCDVGGGAVPNGTRHQLARVPLRWMIRQTFLCNTGILYKAGVLASLGLDVHTLHPACPDRLLPVTMSPAPSLLEKKHEGSLPCAGHSWTLRNARDETESPEVTELNEEAEDYFDALSPMEDMLHVSKRWYMPRFSKHWWILELFPIKQKTQDKSGKWVKKTRPNMGRHRAIRDERPNIHHTVWVREVEGGYKLKNETDFDGEWQTVI